MRSRNHLVLALAIHAFMVLLAAGVIVWLAALRRRLREYGSYLAICATCKKVRPAAGDPTDPENWITVEEYITEESETRLTHGVCPACYRETLREAGIE